VSPFVPPTRFATGANEQAAGNKKMPSLNGCRLAARACAGCFIPNPSGSSTRVKLRNGVRRRCVSLFTDRVWSSHVSHNTARLAEQATWTSGRGEEREPECEKKEKKKLQGRLKKRLFARFSTARRFVPSAVASRACRIGLKGTPSSHLALVVWNRNRDATKETRTVPPASWHRSHSQDLACL